ncbi:hypothetical protein [Maribacter sp. 2307ULW6-5]|uniref:hypothetical protein n=1 Tax=Maribacter sp. 2307ULW6-5 TaxID=3386275 RepID=UPI0039BCF250
MKGTTQIVLALSALFLLNCSPEKDSKFTIANGKVGQLDKNSLARDLELIFAEDSVVMDTVELSFGSGASKINIYEKGGAPLLTITPSTDSIPKIQNVMVQDPRFKTDKGIGTQSTFKDIQAAYDIKKIITSLNNVVILVHGSDAYFTIDKKELPENLRYDTSKKIEAVQIPDNAKIKYFMVGWE